MDHSLVKISYNNEEGSIAKDFLVPCLKECKSYRRITYSFSSAALKSWSGSFTHIVSDNVQIEILCDMTAVLNQDEQLLIALEKSTNKQERRETLEKYTEQEILMTALQFDLNKDRVDVRLKLLDWLVANNQLKIKFAYPKKYNFLGKKFKFHPLYHLKMGYFIFDDGSKIAFKGSWNETEAGSTYNMEDCEVFSSERANDADRLDSTIKRIDRDWDSNNERFDVVGISKKLIEMIKKRSPKTKRECLDLDMSELGPKPTYTEKDLMHHQSEVLADWERNNRKGLVKHATGSGKTFTAIFALKRHLENNQVCLIVVPSTLLQTQWNQEVEKILPECNGEILNVGGNYQKWKKDLPSFSKPTKSNKPKIIIAVVNTAAKNDFRSKLNQGDHLMLIADEVHRLGSDNFSKVFDIKSGPRLGLSATPERYNDPLGTDRIFDYFGNSLEPPYELKDAIGESLVGYKYYPTECQLTQSELDEWDEMSEEIRKLAAKCPRNKKNEIIPSKALQLAQIFRSKIAKTAENKVELTSKILRENFKQGQQWLVYCDSQHQIHSIQQELLNHGLMPSIYHSELKEIVKRATLDDFKNDGGILLSIRCLDEGVDIPSLSHALVIASSQNPRQFIQRRGRVLRKDRDNPEKRKAYIYDLVVYADSNALDSVKSLALTELRRALEFGNNADNKEMCSRYIREIARKSRIDLNEDEDALQIFEHEEEDD